MPLETGHVIDGKYRLVRLIGNGGMGSVYEGENLLIRRRVAIKILHSGSMASADAVRRFEREAQAAGQIGNDHILEVLDLGTLPDGDRYMVMEYLDGETLAARIERHGRLTPEQIAPLARQFLTALASAHAAGIIHRDLKPENIFILRSKAGRADFVKLIDFGISKFSRPFGDGEQRMTRADAVLGTPVYMSPEQARGARETDVRSDIYSCGVILYESVTGTLPFEGESFNDLMFKIALTDAPSPLTVLPSLDPDFAWLINRAIARDPEARFATAQELAEALDAWMRKNGLTETLALPRPSDAFPTNARAGEIAALKKTGTEESWSHSKGGTMPGERRSRVPRVAVVSAAGAVVVGLAIALMVRADPAPPIRAAAEPPASAASEVTAAASPPAATTAESPDKAPAVKAAASAEAPLPSASVAPPPAASAPKAAAHATAAPAERPRPKPAAAQTKAFDLGY